jgi:hypothetical protein
MSVEIEWIRRSGLKGMLLLIAILGMSISTLCQGAAPRTAPVPNDPLEIVSGPIHVVSTSHDRDAILNLLTRARSSYALRSDGPGYDLKVSFMVDSGGDTQYDGAWEMEEIYAPGQGFRWTAKAAAGYSTTQISVGNFSYGEGPGSTLPLRLHEARGALFGPIATPPFVDRDLIRTSTATLNGVELTCVLLSGRRHAATPAPGRRWEEAEECIDPQSGLLKLHSLAPGRYEVYDYSDAPTLAGHTLPRKVTVTESGKTVMELLVESWTGLPAADPALFVLTPEMIEREPAVAMAEARKISVFYKPGPIAPNSTIHPVCVFGVITPSGQVAEAHSLQPSDPNSQAAVESAKRMNFYSPTSPRGRPEQRFVFIIEKFVSSP